MREDEISGGIVGSGRVYDVDAPCLDTGQVRIWTAPADPESGIVLLRMRGEIDISDCPVLAAWLRVHSADHTIVDLSGVRFMAASGASLLVEWQAACERRGGRVSFAAPPEGLVQWILTTCGARDVLVAADSTVR